MVAPAQLASMGAAVAGAGLVGTFFTHGVLPPILQAALAHAFEGALVGYACDVIAVRNVYRTAHAGFDRLVSGVADTVIDDFIRLGDLVSGARSGVDELWEGHRNKVERWLVELDVRGALLDTTPAHGVALLDRPAVRNALSRCSEVLARDNVRARRLHAALLAAADKVPLASFGVPTTRNEVRAKLTAFYNEGVADTLAEWMATVDARQWLDADGQPGVLDDVAVRRAVAHLLREVLKDTKQVERLDELAKAAVSDSVPMAGMVFKFWSPVSWGTNKVVESLESPPKPNGELNRFAREFAACYLVGWEKLSKTERLALAHRVLERSAPSWLDTIAASIATHAKDWTLGHVFRTFVTPDAVQGALRSMSDAFAQPASSGTSPLQPVLVEARAYAAAWLDAWHALPEVQRHAAVEQLIDAIVPPTLARVAGQLEDFDDLVPLAKRALTTRLLGFGADGFVSLLKARTQESLDWIKVNGVITGALLGGAVGVVSALISGQSH